MKLHIAQHFGMCFGVREALRTTHELAIKEPVTLLGQLVHNPVVNNHLHAIGVRSGNLQEPGTAETERVIISAHGTSDKQRHAWENTRHKITDTTCPLVRKAHQALASLVEEGYAPIVIGQRDHVEVKGLVGDFPGAEVILTLADAEGMRGQKKFGIVSQTTQPLELVLQLVAEVKRLHPSSEVRFIDTVCHPTKQRQSALERLCQKCDLILIIGGKNSNNTHQLWQKAIQLGVKAYHIETSRDILEEWFVGKSHVGITAGTSTLDETVEQVVEHLIRAGHSLS